MIKMSSTIAAITLAISFNATANTSPAPLVAVETVPSAGTLALVRDHTLGKGYVQLAARTFSHAGSYRRGYRGRRRSTRGNIGTHRRYNGGNNRTGNRRYSNRRGFIQSRISRHRRHI